MHAERTASAVRELIDPSTSAASAKRVSDGNNVSVLVTSEDTRGQLALVQTLEPRGIGPPPHLHSNEDELVYVLDGEVTFHIEDVDVVASAGDCVLLPREREHYHTVESQEARLLIVLAPAGLESYFEETSLGPPHVAGPPDVRRQIYVEWLVTLAARYGIEITGPRPARDVG